MRVGGKGKIEVGILLAGFQFGIGLQTAYAVDAGFYARCASAYAVADAVAEKCKADARPFTRTFYPGGGSRGERESYRAYFPDSHGPQKFVLGCVLNSQDQLRFVGLYYSPHPVELSGKNDDPIIFVDPNSNVALNIQ